MNLKWMCDYLPPINLWSAPIQPNMNYRSYTRQTVQQPYGPYVYMDFYRRRQLNC